MWNMPVKNHIKDNKLHNLKEAIGEFFLLPKHLAESPQEDKIICTWLLRGALHKDHFSKITAWLAFIPYFWKPSCFLRLPLLPLFLLPLPASPFPSPPQPSPLCHVLVFICWFCSSSFSPCVKNERLKIGWVRGGEEKAASESSNCTSVKSLSAVLRLLSSLHWQLRTTIQPPNPIHIHHTRANRTSIHRQCKMLPQPSAEWLYTNVIFSQHDKRNSIDHPQAAAYKTSFKIAFTTYKSFEKLKPDPCMFFELVINHAHRSVTGEAKRG